MAINNVIIPNKHAASLAKRMLQGAAIGLAVITTFLIGVKYPHPEWGSFWMARPLFVTPLAGAAGAVFFYLTDGIRAQGGWRKAATIFISGIVFIIAIWMGIVLGLAGTLWH